MHDRINVQPKLLSEQCLAMVGEESERVTVRMGHDGTMGETGDVWRRDLPPWTLGIDEVTFKTSSTTSSRSDSGVLCGFLSFAEKKIFSPGSTAEMGN